MKDSTSEEGKEVPAFKQELWYRIVDAWGKHKNTPTEIYNALSGLYEEFIIPKIESATKEPLPSKPSKEEIEWQAKHLYAHDVEGSWNPIKREAFIQGAEWVLNYGKK